MRRRRPTAPGRGAARRTRSPLRIVPAILILAPALSAQAADPSLEEVLARMAVEDKARTDALERYSASRQYVLKNHRFGTSAKLEVRVHYRQPGAKTFYVVSKGGSRVVRERVLKRIIKAELEAARPEVQAATTISPRNYSFRLLTTGTLSGRRAYVLEAIPKAPTRFLFRGRVWVDAEDFAVSRIEGSPALKPSFWVKKTTFVHEYRKLDRFWLPVSNRSTTEVRLFGRTEIAVEYSGYQINDRDEGIQNAEGLERVTLDGAGSAGDDWRAQPAAGKQ